MSHWICVSLERPQEQQHEQQKLAGDGGQYDVLMGETYQQRHGSSSGSRVGGAAKHCRLHPTALGQQGCMPVMYGSADDTPQDEL
jgi:hypothetical protein